MTFRTTRVPALAAGLALVLAAPAAFAAGDDNPPPRRSSAPAASAPATPTDYDYGKRALEAGNYAGAIAYFERAVAADPRNANALNYLGYTYAEMGVKLDEAEALIRRALEIEPNDGFYVDSLGWVYYQRGDYEVPRVLPDLAGIPRVVIARRPMG